MDINSIVIRVSEKGTMQVHSMLPHPFVETFVEIVKRFEAREQLERDLHPYRTGREVPPGTLMFSREHQARRDNVVTIDEPLLSYCFDGDHREWHSERAIENMQNDENDDDDD